MIVIRSRYSNLVTDHLIILNPDQGDRMATIQRYAAKGVWDPPAYSQAVKVTGAQTILYIAGQVAYDDKGGPAHVGDFKAQARATFQALKAQVEAGGGTMDSIVKINTYLTDIRHRADLATIREEFLGKKSPASTLVAVAALAMPGWMIEIEAVAVI
jgi:enamine deaminase RidA (YjgF/YER057c/UK114 family)